MYTKQEIIIRSYREGQSQRRISRELHISRTTVKKYIEDYEQSLSKETTQGETQLSHLTSPPIYKSGNRSKLKLTIELQALIDGFLETNQQKKRQGLRKQTLKKKDILEELQRQGFDIGYTTVCNYIKSKESGSTTKEAFIRQHYSAGEICEFDWGEIKLKIGDRLKSFQLAVFTCAYSNYRYAFIYQRQDTLSFMDSHVRFFDTVGGVFKQMVYDNMRVAVSKFIGPHEKEPTKALLQLRGHYRFSHRFCNAYRGNEKGHVERSVEYIRRKAFSLKYDFVDIEDANNWLSMKVEKLNDTVQTQKGETANQMFIEEKSRLGELPLSKLICADQIQLRTDKYATLSFRTNRYSVPDNLVGKFLDVNILSNEIHVYYQNKRVATHKRSYGRHQWIIDIEHYLSTFKQKPGALPSSHVLVSNTYLKGIYIQHFQGEARNFIDLLEFCRDNKVSNEKLEESLKRLLSTGNGILTTEKLRALLGNSPIAENLPEEDKIHQMSKQQLIELTKLMHQTN